jgi:WD40 repeat protein/nucleoside phosphorylase/type II secretory pathway predicted ATPase ExeA
MSRARMDVLIMTALKEELDAVLALEGGPEGRGTWRLLRDRHGFPYHVRELQNAFGEVLHIAAAWSGQMGESAAASRAASLVEELEPECLAMCGICAGKRGKVFQGDVIVADRAFSYDHGKLIAGSAEQGGGFFHDITTYNLEATWRMEAAYFAQDFLKSWTPAQARPVSKETQERWLLLALHASEQQSGLPPDKHPARKERCPGWAERIQALRARGLLDSAAGVLRLTEQGRAWVAEALLLDPEGQASDPAFNVHVGPMATGKTVREDPELFQRLERHVRKVLGVEMEGAAISQVSEQLGRRSIIAKAVSDYGDHDKDDGFREFACHASAAFLLAFLRKYLRAREPGVHPLRGERSSRGAEGEEGQGREPLRRDHRDGFLRRVERATRLHQPAGTQIVRVQGVPPFELYLEVSVQEGKFTRIYPVAALDQPLSREAIEAFIREILTRYEWENPLIVSTLVHVGQAASVELARLAESKRINLLSFAEYQGLLDFSEYLRRQTERLEKDPIYPPGAYVEQRGKVSVGGQPPEAIEDVLETIRRMLDSPDSRFALVLGEFGTGKTFLLHELARRMSQEQGAALIPVLIEMRSLQKQRTLRELIAQHFAAGDVTRFEVEKFLYMLKEGRIALLFDGFDELALRVTYDQVMEHFHTLIEAAEGKAKVIVTSRTQHFLTDHEVKRELARRAESLPGYRLIKLERFNEEQIRRFLVKRLGSEALADERLALLRDVKELLGLSENPRLLSFILELEVEKLQAAREGSGEITSAKLYELLIDKWLHGEYVRVSPPGAPKGLKLEQLRRGTTALALLLWGRVERTVSMSELPAELLEAWNAQEEHTLEAEKVRHQLGSGSLLVRDEDGRFSFVHQSVMEWLVAEAAARGIRGGGEAAALGQRKMSLLMVDFFIALTGREEAWAWAERKAVSAGDEVAKYNALLIAARLGFMERSPRAGTHELAAKNLEGHDLRSHDLTKAELRQANLRKANLSGVPLVEADLSGATLEGASLARAELAQANLQGADLTGADLTGARLFKADLRGAKLQGTKLRMARLTGALVDSLEGSDVFGAALPHQLTPEPQLAGHSACFTVCFSPADGLLATGHDDGTVRLWDADTATVLRVMRGHVDHVWGLAFSPDGQLLASASEDGTVRLWNVAGWPQAPRVLEGHSRPVYSVSFSPNGALLASGSEDTTVRLWSVASGQARRVLEGHERTVFSVAWSPDGSVFASGSEDATVRLWTLGQQGSRVLIHAAGPVSGVVFSLDGASLAVSSHDGMLRLLRLDGTEEPHVLEGNSGSMEGLAISPDGSTLAAACADGTVDFWSLAEKRRVGTSWGDDEAMLSVGFSPDGALVAAACDDGSVRIWGYEDGAPRGSLGEGEMAEALSVAFSSPETLICAADDSSLQLWNVETGQLTKVHARVSEEVRSGNFSSEGARFAAVTSEGTAQVWSVADGRVLRVLWDRQLGPAQRAQLSPDGKVLALAAMTGPIALWNIDTGKKLAVLEGHKGVVQDLAFSPDGKMVAAGSSDQHIWLWRVFDGTVVGTLKGHQDVVQSIVFSSNSRSLVSSSKDETLRFWDVTRRHLLRTLKDPGEASVQLKFDPQGRFLAAISQSGRVVLLRLGDGRVHCTLSGHTAAARGCAFHPDGKLVAVAYQDGVVGLHEVASGTCLARLLRVADGWVALREDGHFKHGGKTTEALWFSIGLCRFDAHELPGVLGASWLIPGDEPLLAKAGA